VWGESGSSVGVFGDSSSSIGMYGASSSNVGVLGNSTSGVGVVGSTSSAHGVFGQSFAAAGTVVPSPLPGAGMLAGGVVGLATNNVALYGYANGPANGSNPPFGAIGQSANGFGVWGLSSAPAGIVATPYGGSSVAASGLLGSSASNVGVYAVSTGSYALVADANAAATTGALIRGNAGGPAAMFMGNVFIQGSYTATGSKSAAVKGADGSLRRLYSLESPESWFEDFGSAQLNAGTAAVQLAADFAPLVHGDDYHVFLTPRSEPKGPLYVSNKTPGGFTVREAGGGTSSIGFSYRIVARRKDIPGARLEKVDAPAVSLPVGHGVPVLPASPPTQPPPAPPTPAGTGAPGR